jgi:hypothetical protein
MRLRRKILWSLLAGFVFILLFAHPYFAVTRPSGGRVLVAEGWMRHEGLRETAELFRHGGYEHLYVTGTVRPFSYFLRHHEAIEVDLDHAAERLEVALGGLPGAHRCLTADGDTLLTTVVGRWTTTHVVDLTGRARRGFRLTAWSDAPPADHAPIGFIKALHADGVDAHESATMITIRRTDGRTMPGPRTHAEDARIRLIDLGVPDSLITAVPTWKVGTGGRTSSSARTLVAYARAHGIGAFDVATLAVHARRTWKSYRKAYGGQEAVGIIALHDPWCKRWTWWTNYYGVFQMAKEIAALPQTWWNDLH